MSAHPHLFSLLTVGGVELRNRVVQTGHVTGIWPPATSPASG
jgi:hypothetical protein